MHPEHDLAVENSEELILRPDAQPTMSYYNDEHYLHYVEALYTKSQISRPPMEPDALGPYFRKGAPYRAKVTPPNEPGTSLIISGRIWGIDSRRPLDGTIIDIWQANMGVRYDNEDPAHPPAPSSFKNRVRLVSDEHGKYEYETIHPGPYRVDPTTWRSPHIHYHVTHNSHKQLITQLFFQGDHYEDSDPFFKRSLAIPLTLSQTDLPPVFGPVIS
jgi:catechol 1,2-dioxygenase